MFWTGREALVSGGGTAGFYDPCTRQWRRAEGGPPSPNLSDTVQVGNEFLYLRVVEDMVVHFTSYDFVKNSVRVPNRNGVPIAEFSTKISVGAELLVWGGAHAQMPGSGQALWTGTNQGAIYDPRTDRWRPMTTGGAPAARIAPAAWNGSALAIWGGKAADTVSGPQGYHACASLAGLPDVCPRYADGALYDPVADRWTAMASEGAPTARHGHLLAWSGKKLLVFGGRGGGASPSNPEGELFTDGALYDPEARTWKQIARAPYSAAQSLVMRAHWTGTRLVVTGGANGGWIYEPESDLWSEVPGDGCFSSLSVQAGALAGFCLRGDRQVALLLAPGARSWAEYPLPEKSPVGSAILWTGKRLFVWGGVPANWNSGCQNPPPGVGCDPAAPPPSNEGWQLVP
jgi:hypothetical protein